MKNFIRQEDFGFGKEDTVVSCARIIEEKASFNSLVPA